VHLCTVAAQDIDCAVIAPPLSITASGEHAGFPGTISIGTEALVAVIVELVRSCDWASGVILAHGHGGNLAAVQRATTLLHSEERNVANWWPHIQGADAHAGHTETSLMMAINPRLVRMDKLDIGNVQPMREMQCDLQTRGVQAVSPNGILGNARTATAEYGDQLVAMLTEDLRAFIHATCQQWNNA
jgi:creatinine amidohydrolase